MRHIAIMSIGPNWESSGKDGSQGPIMKAHYDYMKGLYEMGVLVLGGPFKRAAGGLNVLESENKDAAEAALAEDPGVKAGLFTFEVREHYTMFDREADFVRPFPGG